MSLQRATIRNAFNTVAAFARTWANSTNISADTRVKFANGQSKSKTTKRGMHPIFDTVRDFLHDEAMEGHERILQRYLQPVLLIIDDAGIKELPQRSGEHCSRSSCASTCCVHQ